jgi:riboflavin synthase alpha subunit
MPFYSKRSLPYFAAALVLSALAAAGCANTFTSGLPEHIRTVEVHIFRNKTMYKSVEAWITRDIVDRINMDPSVRVASRNGDALITGEIMAVRRSTIRETTANEPGTVQITIEARFSFYDNKDRRFIIEDARVASDEVSLTSGIYEATAGETSEDGERAASRQIAAEIVRRTIGMW